jgi:hypothetical protein
MKKYAVIVIAALGVMAAIGQARAQVSPLYTYSVKFVCGLQSVPSSQFPPPREPTVKPGNYATAINVHNYHVATSGTSFRKKAVIARPESVSPRGPISTIVGEKLGPNQALSVDCNEIAKLFPSTVPLPPFIDGFVEIVSPVQLSVTAVYTTQTCNMPAGSKGCASLGDLSIEVVPQTAFRDQ